MKLFVVLAIVAFVGCSLVEGRSIVARDTKSDLTTKGKDLETKLESAITKLTTDKKLHEVAILKHEDTLLKKLITDLTAATETAAITRVEHELARLEARVTHQLAAIDKTPVPATPATPSKRDTKSDLTTKGTDLVTKLDTAITKLTADKKTHEVAILKREETILKKLVADLTAATETAAITRLEHELTRLEARVTHQLDAINKTPAVPVPPTKRATKEELVTKGKDLVKKADEAIVKLTADKKTHEVTVIKSEEAKINKLIADLDAATDDAKVKQLEHALTAAELKLQHELTKVNAAPKPPTF